MRAIEITERAKKPGKANQVKQYLVKVKIRSPGYTNIVDTVVYAVNPQWARKLVRAQYSNNKNVLIGQPKEIKTRN